MSRRVVVRYPREALPGFGWARVMALEIEMPGDQRNSTGGGFADES